MTTKSKLNELELRCRAKKIAHRVCQACGYYNNKEIIKLEKKTREKGSGKPRETAATVAKNTEKQKIAKNLKQNKTEVKDKNPEIEDIFIDVGYNFEQASSIVKLGDRATIASKANILLNNKISVKALDDRAGVASILYALSMIKKDDLKCNLIVLFSAQEETGERGAKTSAFKVNPDISISVDVSFAYTSDAIEHKCGKMGKGVMIGIAPTLNKEVSRELQNLAQENDIYYQLEVMGGATSTNCDVIGTTKNGIKTGLLSIPLKYMHSPIEMASIDDIISTSKLISKFVMKAGESNV
jgi:endoglucanase